MLAQLPVRADIPEDIVFRFDIYKDDRFAGDLHHALLTLHRDAPHIFWTIENGGHWAATRFATMQKVLSDHDSFSAAGNQAPNVPESMPMIPLKIDPPAHNYYRSILMRHFGPTAIKKMEPSVEHWAKTLVDAVADKGHCDFMDEFASLFPVSNFMEMMGLSLDDLATKLQTDKIDGRDMTMAELESLTNLLFQAGIDTVANFAVFFLRYLGTRPELQREMRDNPDKLALYVDEGFRMLGVVNNVRRVRHDLELDGVAMRQGDIVMCMHPLGGMDARKNADPSAFDVDRRGRDHMLFSKGVHLCIGHTLARAEMKMLLKQWFSRIPNSASPKAINRISAPGR